MFSIPSTELYSEITFLKKIKLSGIKTFSQITLNNVFPQGTFLYLLFTGIIVTNAVWPFCSHGCVFLLY